MISLSTLAGTGRAAVQSRGRDVERRRIVRSIDVAAALRRALRAAWRAKTTLCGGIVRRRQREDLWWRVPNSQAFLIEPATLLLLPKSYSYEPRAEHDLSMRQRGAS